MIQKSYIQKEYCVSLDIFIFITNKMFLISQWMMSWDDVPVIMI